MRAFLLGLLGGLVALLIGGAVVAAVMVGRERAAQDNRRTVLLRQIDEYEAWYDTSGASLPPNQRPVSVRGSHDRFMTLRPELRAYLSWTVETRRAEGGRGFMAAYRDYSPTLDELRNEAWMARYLPKFRPK